MSKEAMQSVALFAKSGAKRKDGKPIPPSWILCLTWMAYYSRDSEQPYRAKTKQDTLATLCQVKDARAVAKMLDGLEALGVVKRAEKEGRENVYELHLEQYRPHSTGNDEYRPYRADVQEETPAPQYPYQVQHRPHRADNSTQIPALQAQNTGPTGANTGPTGASLPIREKKEEREKRGDAHTRDPISASLVMSADQAFRVILDYLEGEVSDHERRTWRERIRAGWSAPDMLCLRGPSSLVRLPRFTGCIRMAAKQLGLDAAIEFRAIVA